MSNLILRGITKRFGGATVLDDVSLDVADGEFLVLVGPSGCGKSTLLRIIAGLETATAGDLIQDGVRVNDRDPAERDVAMVFQNYALYPHMTVRKNLAFPLRLRRLPDAEIERRVVEVSETLGLRALLDRKPGTLSGGQMQRVALGRAIIRSPRLFLFDEPLSNLDAKLRSEMRGEIARLHEKLKITTIYVTHDQAEAMTMGTRIAVLEAGRVRQIGPPLEVFARPISTFVASFIGSPPMSFLRGRVACGRFVTGPLSVPCAFPEGTELVLGIRPHAVAIEEQLGSTPLPVVFVEQLGSQTLIECSVDGQRLVISCEGHHPARTGDLLPITLPEGSRHWFDVASGARI